MFECVVIFVGLILDQLSKIWIVHNVVGKTITVLPGVFSFIYVENTGAAFGMLGESTVVLAALSGVAAVALSYVLWKFRKELPFVGRLGLAMLISGAIGNFIDRAAIGYVVDFIRLDFVNFAIFNVADSLVNVGTALLVLAMIFSGSKKNKVAEQAAETDAGNSESEESEISEEKKADESKGDSAAEAEDRTEQNP